MRFVVERRLVGHDRRFDWRFRSRFFLLDRKLGSRWLRNICLQIFLGKLLAFSRRQESHLAEHAIESAPGGIALRFALEELFESLLCLLPLVSSSQGISQTRQRVGQAEGIAGAAVQFHEPFQRFDALRHAGIKLVEQFPDDLVLPGIDHGEPRLFQNGHGFFAVSGLQKRFDHFLHRPIIFLVRFEYAVCEGRGLVPIGVLEIKIEKEFGLLAALFEIGSLLE